MKSKYLILSENITPFILYSVILIGILLISIIILILNFVNSAPTQIECVYLAKANELQEDRRPPRDRLVINLAHFAPPGGRCSEFKYDMNGKLVTPCQNKEHWKIKIKGKEIQMPELIQILIVEGDFDRERPDDSTSLSNRIVMIRSDAGAPWNIVKQVLSACRKARFWKIELGASKLPED